MSVCSVQGCSLGTRTASAALCEKHYMRNYRNGTTDAKNTAAPFEHSGGYRLVPARGHFLARGSSHAYEHRISFHASNGNGPFNCHWCAVQVTWDDMHVDHLDDDKKNNDPANLVASCPQCNQKRGKHKAVQTWRQRTGIEAFGQVKTMSEWAREFNISRPAITRRLALGWTMERALSEPRGKFGPKPK